MSAIIEVKWNGKKFPVEFQSIKELETTTVKHLKAYIQRMTGINANSIRLQAFGGKRMREKIKKKSIIVTSYLK